MLTLITAAIPGLLSLAIHGVQWWLGRSAAQSQAASASQLQQLKDTANADVAKGNIDTLRRDLS